MTRLVKERVRSSGSVRTRVTQPMKIMRTPTKELPFHLPFGLRSGDGAADTYQKSSAAAVFSRAGIFLPTTLLVVLLSLALALLPIFSCAATERALDSKILANAIEKEPNNHALRVIAGFHYFDQGNFELAEMHFRKAAQLTPGDPYDQTWLYMTQLRRDKSASDKDIRAFLSKKKSDAFVYNNILVLLSDVAPEVAIEKARASNDSGNLCEAYYYAAQHALLNGHYSVAKEHLQGAIKTGKEKFWEYKSAVACLQLLLTNEGIEQEK
jgi:lipoprotein NlpI